MSWTKMEKITRRAAYDVVYFAEKFLGVRLHEGQKRWAREGLGSYERVLAAGNRWGKSFVAGVITLHHALFGYRRGRVGEMKGYVACCVAPTLQQARIVWERALGLLHQSPYLAWAIEGVRTTPFPRISLRNGAQIWARSIERGEALWGYGFDFVNFDEPAYVKNPQEVLTLLRTRVLDRGGRIDYTGTPTVKNWYYELFKRGQEGEEGYFSMQGKTWENPYISRETLAWLEENLSEKERAVHIEGEFVEREGTVFAYEEIASCIEEVENFGQAKEGHSYVSGWDIGLRRDWTVGITLDITQEPFRVVDFKRFKGGGWGRVYAEIRETAKRFWDCPVIVDSTGVGDPVVDELSDIGASGYCMSSRKAKFNLIHNLKMNLKRVRFPYIRELVDEMCLYEWDDKSLRCDCVIALALAVWGAAKMRRKVAHVHIVEFGREKNVW